MNKVVCVEVKWVLEMSLILLVSVLVEHDSILLENKMMQQNLRVLQRLWVDLLSGGPEYAGVAECRGCVDLELLRGVQD